MHVHCLPACVLCLCVREKKKTQMTFEIKSGLCFVYPNNRHCQTDMRIPPNLSDQDTETSTTGPIRPPDQNTLLHHNSGHIASTQ